MKLLDWIIPEKLDYNNLSLNYNAIHLLKENPDNINWINLAKNPNGYLIFKDNMDKLNNDKEIRRLFIENCPCIDFLRNIIKLELHNNQNTSSDVANDVVWLCGNKYAQTLINDCFDYSCLKYYSNNKDLIYKGNHEQSIEERFNIIRETFQRVKLVYLLRYRNPVFIPEFEKYFTENGVKNYDKAKLFLNCCAGDIHCLCEIPNTEEYQELLSPKCNKFEYYFKKGGKGGSNLNLAYYVDMFGSLIYTKNIEFVKNVIDYILCDRYGWIYEIEGNVKIICKSITTNPLSYGIIDDYLKKNIFDEKLIHHLFYALSSQENSYVLSPYKNDTAIQLLYKYKKYINWSELSKNKRAIHLLEQNKEKINWSNISLNPNIFCK